MNEENMDEKFSIVIDINENYKSYRENAKSNKDEFKNKFVLFYTTWNDYGFYTKLVVRNFYENSDGKIIGTIRICHDDLVIDNNNEEAREIRYFLEKDYKHEVKNDKENKLSDKYISIADSFLYDNLKKELGKDESVIEFLSNLNEISTITDNGRIKKIKDKNWYKASFIRYDEDIVAFTECKNILKIEYNSYVVKKRISIFLLVVGEALARLDRIEMDKSRNEIEVPAELKIIMKEDKVKISDFLSKLNKYCAKTDKIKIIELEDKQRNDEQIYASLEHKNDSDDNCTYFEKYISDVFYAIKANIGELYKWMLESELSYVEIKESLQFINLSNDLDKEHVKYLMEFKEKYLENTYIINNINEIIGEFANIYDNVNTIKKILRLVYNGDELCNFELGHYTSLETIKKLIKNKNKGGDSISLRLTNGRQMNDPLEGKVLLDYILNRNKDSDKNTSTNNWEPTYWYMSSATTELDSLPMWKQYGKDATGGMLVYKNEYLLDIMRRKVEIYKVAYIDINKNNKYDVEVLKTDNITNEDVKKLKIAIYVLRKEIEGIKNTNNLNDNRKLMELLSDIAFLFKKSDYAYESEYRIVVNREGSEDRIVEQDNPSFNFPFLYTYLDEVKLKYSKLILGPKAIDIDYIAPYINYCDKDIEIERSSISYR